MESNNQKPKDPNIFEYKAPQRKRPIDKLKTIRDTVMGLLYIAVGIALIWAEKNGFTTFGLKFTYALAAVFSVYGIFRLYRALIQKQ
ncbi:MAG TPA: hypothetical protein VLZ83_03620 [Edaphocola sp.]|nr:hypothetical protein [Edaphocola sp.]